MLPLRLCYLKLDCVFHEKCYLPYSPFKDFQDLVVSGFNVSLLAKDSTLKTLVNASYAIDDCLLSVQTNESDAILLPYTMPLMMNNIKTGPVFFSDKLEIISTYKFENDSSPGIFATFDAFGLDAITLILNFFILLAALICFTYILERNSPRRRVRINGRRFNLRFVPWFIFCFFVKQFPSFPGNMTALKVLLTCCLLTFSYFVTFFYSSMIKTDMVTVKAPRVIASYQDILDDPSIQPYIRHNFDEFFPFKNAPSGSIKRKIWERILKMGVDKHVFGSDWDREDIVFYDDRHPLMNSKAVIMAYASTTHFVEYLFGVVLKNHKENRKMLFASDPAESTKLSASVLNRMTSPGFSHLYLIRMRRFLEADMWRRMVDNTGLSWAEYYMDLLDKGKDFSYVHEYVDRKVILPEAILVKANMDYFMFLFILYFVLCVTQTIIFLIEIWASKKEQNIA